ncbi:MAG: UDP-N-acetylmuramoyl-L-alanyl-D-glutamate--2,6-diaminopimelate ligase [Proteobacteria bacterium]|nr:UDP-N-acetylmuramoyl-L-alanyl-D-glutamate--2,6-diaminopimelate ligase [Pseudomonadota bacterium]
MTTPSILLLDLLHDFIHPDQNLLIKGLTQDSRAVSPGDLFIAVPGLQVDGRNFVAQAVSKGAAAIMYENGDGFQIPAEWSNYSIPIIGYSGLNAIISLIAARFYQNPTQQMTVIGVTGTNGKTSVSQIIAQALTIKGRRCAVMGTLGQGFLPNLQPTGYTTPDSVNLQKQLAGCRQQGADSVSMEVSSHSLCQDRVSGVDFDIAVFTNLTRDHLDYHKTMEAYGAAKAKLFQFPSLQACIYNADDDFGRVLLEKHSSSSKSFAYSVNPHIKIKNSLVHAQYVRPEAKGFQIHLNTPWGSGEFHLPLLGRFNISNALAVITVLGALAIPLSECLSLAEHFQPVKGRMHAISSNGSPLVIVDYAHTPDALEQVLTSLREHRPRQLWCVFGCGGNRDRGKRPQMGMIAAKYSDHILLTNDNPRNESPKLIIAEIKQGIPAKACLQILPDRLTAIRAAINQAGPEDIVLIAGKGHENEQIIGDQVVPFSDIDTVKLILSTL